MSNQTADWINARLEKDNTTRTELIEAIHIDVVEFAVAMQSKDEPGSTFAFGQPVLSI